MEKKLQIEALLFKLIIYYNTEKKLDNSRFLHIITRKYKVGFSAKVTLI